MKSNKKAQEESHQAAVLAIVIIAILSIFIVGGFVFQYLGIFKNKGDIEACKLDVMKAFASKLLNKGTPLTRIDNCERGDVKVFTDESIEEINTHIAKEIDNCMYKFNYGNMDWRKSPWFNVNKPVACFICGQFKFEGESKNKYRGSSSLVDYSKNYRLKNEKIMFDFIEETNLKTSQNKSEFMVYINNGDPFNDVTSTYIITISHMAEPLLDKLIPDKLNFKIPIGFGYVLYPELKDLYILSSLSLGPTQNILPYCELLMN